MACGFSVARNLHAQTPKPTEYEVEAAYLSNFGRFVEWPASDFFRQPAVPGRVHSQDARDMVGKEVCQEQRDGQFVRIGFPGGFKPKSGPVRFNRLKMRDPKLLQFQFANEDLWG